MFPPFSLLRMRLLLRCSHYHASSAFHCFYWGRLSHSLSVIRGEMISFHSIKKCVPPKEESFVERLQSGVVEPPPCRRPRRRLREAEHIIRRSNGILRKVEVEEKRQEDKIKMENSDLKGGEWRSNFRNIMMIWEERFHIGRIISITHETREDLLKLSEQVVQVVRQRRMGPGTETYQQNLHQFLLTPGMSRQDVDHMNVMLQESTVRQCIVGLRGSNESGKLARVSRGWMSLTKCESICVTRKHTRIRVSKERKPRGWMRLKSV